MRFFSNAHWPTRPSPKRDLARQGLALALRVARQQLELRVAAAMVRDVERGLLRVHQRRQLAQDQPGHRDQVAMALQHAGEPREVGLQPVLLGVLARGVLEVADHLVDVVLQRGHLALRFHRDRARQVALGHRGRDFGDRAHLGGEVRREPVHVLGQVPPQAGGARHPRLPAELAFDCRLRAPRWSPGRRRSRACRSCR